MGRDDSKDPPDARAAAQASGADAAGDAQPDPGGAVDARDRRSAERVEVTWVVDCEAEDTFLYASITNISELGIFVRTTTPLPIGSRLTLRFSPPGAPVSFVLRGAVQWVNELQPLRETPNPGMGICFLELTLDDRERIVGAIRTIAYLREAPVTLN